MDIKKLLNAQRAFFESGGTRPLDFRFEQLRKLKRKLEAHEQNLLTALRADLGKSPYQVYSTELGLLHAEISHVLKRLSSWARPDSRRTPWFVAPAKGWVQPEPFGVALILGPWNYPLQLLLTPLISAIAAGNCAVLKPSELAPRSAEAVAALISDSFPADFVSAVLGDAETAKTLLRERFDKIFFTGSANVGREIMASAARHLTPTTLELGGKCPAIVCADASPAQAARRITWGKFMNAGQTCVAPDFVLVAKEVAEDFRVAVKKSLHEFYGDDPAASPDYGRIINARHFARLTGYLSEGRIFAGGDARPQELYLAPTVLTEVSLQSPVMQEEIFGPILPIIEFESLEEIFSILDGRPTPLALYLFTSSRATGDTMLRRIPSGGVCLNDVVSHILAPSLPFGGLGESGLGSYHGRAGFDAFSHSRSVLRKATWLDSPFRYPPQRVSLLNLKRAMRLLFRA